MQKDISIESDFIAPTVVLICQSDGIISQCSSHVKKVFGYTRNDLVGQTIDMIFPGFDNQKLNVQSLSDLKKKENILTEGNFHAQQEDSSKIAVFVTELFVKEESGEKYIITVQSLSLLNNRHLLYLKLEEKLYQAQKLEAIGLLTCNIVHDLNNMLYVILSNTDSLLIESNNYIDEPNRLESIRKATLHISELTKQVLVYSADSEINKSNVVITEIVEDMKILLQTSFGSSIKVFYDLIEETPPISAIPGQIRQVILNFITNACESIGSEKGTVNISTGTTIINHDQFDYVSNNNLPFGHYVYIQVIDDGKGIEPGTLVDIFDPFFSTKRREGRGLGLYSVLGIVKEHGGAITIDSSFGKGATFTALFPIQNEFFLELTDYLLLEKEPAFEYTLACDE